MASISSLIFLRKASTFFKTWNWDKTWVASCKFLPKAAISAQSILVMVTLVTETLLFWKFWRKNYYYFFHHNDFFIKFTSEKSFRESGSAYVLLSGRRKQLADHRCCLISTNRIKRILLLSSCKYRSAGKSFHSSYFADTASPFE